MSTMPGAEMMFPERKVDDAQSAGSQPTSALGAARLTSSTDITSTGTRSTTTPPTSLSSAAAVTWPPTGPNPYYLDALVAIYHGDCREWTPEADVIVTDPPYGMGNDGDTTRFTGGALGIHRRGMGKVRPQIVGDDLPFDPTPWLDYPHVVLWGSNHFGAHLPVGTTLVWLKRPDHLFGSFLSDAEVAWMKGGHGVYAYRHDWAGFSRIATDGESVHQNQKPIALMRWCIQRAGGTGTVLDPFMGSGSTLVAAKSLGRHAIGIEIEERYCEVAARRCAQEVLGLVG